MSALSPVDDNAAVELLRSMVEVQSPSRAEAVHAAHFTQCMRNLGLESEVDGAGNAVGVVGRGPTEGVLLGHQDTVPGEVPVRLEAGRLYGRGSVDAKGPLAAFAMASARVFRRMPDAPLRVTVVGAVEEEVPSSRGARFVRERYRPHFCINGEPSGWDAMTLGYKGYLRVDVCLAEGSHHAAHRAATVAERGCAAWARIDAATRAFNTGRGRAFEQILTRLVDLSTRSDGRTDEIELALDVRLPLDVSPAEAEAWLAEQVPEAALRIRGRMPAWAGPRTTPLHRALARAIGSQGRKPRYLHKTGTADINLVAPVWRCPAVTYGPGDAALDHTPDEHIVVKEYLAGIRVLEHTLEACARNGEALRDWVPVGESTGDSAGHSGRDGALSP